MLLVMLFSIAIIYIIGSLVLDSIYFQKLKLFQRAIFHSILMFIFLVTVFSLVALFTQEVELNVYFGFVIMSLIVSLVFGGVNYASAKFGYARIERLREQYSKLPDGPEKQQKLKLLEHLEKMRNK